MLKIAVEKAHSKNNMTKRTTKTMTRFLAAACCGLMATTLLAAETPVAEKVGCKPAVHFQR